MQIAAAMPLERYYSGGGLSNYHAMPEYQLKDVQSYIKKSAPECIAGIYNQSGRG